MDWGSLVGLFIALAAILLGQWVEGGQLGSLFQPAALVIVLGGTVGSVLLQSGWANLLRGMRMLKLAFTQTTAFYPALLETIQTWNLTARMGGFLKLERYIAAAPDPFIAKGLRLVVDGVDPCAMREILELDIASYERDQRQAIKIWDAAGGYAPTIGILGAVLGLIRIMENLAEPSLLGSGIAVAFVSTIYGVGLANLICLPVSNKLKQHVQQEILKREMLTEALIGISRGDKFYLIRERLSSYWQHGG
jgi:chemotaxis protein MotA